MIEKETGTEQHADTEENDVEYSDTFDEYRISILHVSHPMLRYNVMIVSLIKSSRSDKENIQERQCNGIDTEYKHPIFT
jgi:hypothetical protein